MAQSKVVLGAPSENPGREIPFQGGLSADGVRGLSEFIKTHYLDASLKAIGTPYRESWSQDRQTVELSWTVAPPLAPGRATDVRGPAATLTVSPRSAVVAFPDLNPSDVLSVRLCTRTADDVEELVTSFLLKAKTTSLYFIFSSGPNPNPDVPGASSSPGNGMAKRILAGNMVNLYLLIMAASFVLFLIFGFVAIFAVLGIQLFALFFSDRLALAIGKVRPSSDRPNVTLVCVPASPETHDIVTRYAKNVLPEMTDRLEKALEDQSPDSPEARAAIEKELGRYGLHPQPGDVRIITRNVYGLVKSVADRFHLPVPKIVIMNNIAANAAATGVAPSRASISITAGSLEDLDDSELASVVGHEMGHIKGRDSIILFCVTFFIYVGGLYIWLPLIEGLGLFFYVYYVLVFAVIYAVGKVLETRADTESVINLGQPEVLADALTNIGFRQLYYEKYSPGLKLADWLRFDPHPPIYFRVQRLSKLATVGSKVRHAFLTSLRDCAAGFFGALAGS